VLVLVLGLVLAIVIVLVLVLGLVLIIVLWSGSDHWLSIMRQSIDTIRSRSLRAFLGLPGTYPLRATSVSR
jgi:Na+-driven multidrug efflux pump